MTARLAGILHVGQMMAEAGVTSQPQPVFWHALDMPDRF